MGKLTPSTERTRKFYQLFKSQIHCNNAASGDHLRSYELALETVRYTDIVPVCPSCPSDCVWIRYIDGAIKRCLVVDFSASLNGFYKTDHSKLRKSLYREINEMIPGSIGRRRALPNCVVAGIRGLVYGTGERTGYHNNASNPSSNPDHDAADDGGNGDDDRGEKDLIFGEGKHQPKSAVAGTKVFLMAGKVELAG